MNDELDKDSQPGKTSRLDLNVDSNETIDIPKDSPLFRKIRNKLDSDAGTASNQRQIVFIIRGITESLPFTESLSAIIGRSDVHSGSSPDLDLTPYGAQERGVSRKHAKLQIVDDQVFITDLNSSNGTFINAVRIEPEIPTPLASGGTVMLGRLSIQVIYE
jgi:hypothetical protein